MKKNLCLLRFPVLFAIFMLLQPSSLWAADTKFMSNGVTWTGDADKVCVSRDVLTSDNGVWYATWLPEHTTLEFLYYKSAISVFSPFLENVKSISFRVARTGNYDSVNGAISIRSHATSSEEAVSNGWAWTTCNTVSSISHCMTSDVATPRHNQPYDASLYDEVSYTFDTPFTGYLSLYIGSTNFQYSEKTNSYLIIPEITITFDEPSGPSPCPNCFLVTF